MKRELFDSSDEEVDEITFAKNQFDAKEGQKLFEMQLKGKGDQRFKITE